jgi:23S rRNA pseudouridine1911/1915/1917 synthase
VTDPRGPGDDATSPARPLDGDDDDGDEPLAAPLEPTGPVQHTLVVDDGVGRVRVDALLAGAGFGLSRARVQALIEDGAVTVDGAPCRRPADKVGGGARVVVAVPAAAPLEVIAEDIPLRVVYEDAHVIAVDKPAGLVVHPAPGHPRGTLVNALLFHCRDLSGIGGVLRPGIVHRLDKDTSGVMIASKHDAAHAALTAAFADKTTMVREYLALCCPAPARDRFTLDTLHGRHPVDRKRFSSKVASGKRAVTHVVVEARFDPDGEGGPAPAPAARLRVRLETGRTHQIRVHAADHGFPLIADPVYGVRPRSARIERAAAAIGRQALHAERLELDHPITGARLCLSAAAPPDFLAAEAALRA